MSHSGSDYSTVVLVNTILVSHTVGITVAVGDSATLTATLWHGNTIADWDGNGDILTSTLAHNHWDDPAFVDAAGGDYHITADSPARDIGVDADVDTDIDGEPRPHRPAHDIGADEYWLCPPLISVGITGTFTATTGIGTIFTATVHPPTATLPITYTWEATEQLSFTQRGGISNTAVLTWHSGGSQIVTVTAVNECGRVVSRTHVIAIEVETCNALADLGIGGPATTTVGIPTVFTATVAPSDAALPVTYTWQATGQTSATHSDGISDTTTFTWSVRGPHVVTVTAVNECRAEASETHAITVEAPPCIGLTDVGINGPREGYTNTLYGFTGIITPSDGSEPITYTWTPTPDGGQGTVSASYTWLTIGTKVITLTAENCGGMFAAIHTITISATQDGCPKPLSDVGISGPTSGYTGTIYGFSAVITPSDATEAVTYTWTPEPDSGQGAVSVSYTWPTTGTKVITLTAENCGGVFVAIHTIAISATQDGCPKPLSDVNITGPTSGYAGTAYGLTAAITPSDATEPISYTWTPEPDSGQETDEVTYSWSTTGNKIVSVEVENCGGSASDDHTIAIHGLSDESVYLPLVLRNQ